MSSSDNVNSGHQLKMSNRKGKCTSTKALSDVYIQDGKNAGILFDGQLVSTFSLDKNSCDVRYLR